LRRFLLVCTALALALGLNECALRLLWHNPFAREAPELVLVLRAQHGGSDRVLDRAALKLEPRLVHFRTDARGYIEPVRRIAEPEFTLAFQGGSTTECLVVQEELRWPNQVAVQLEPLGFEVNALNAGLSGNTAHDSLVNLIEVVSRDRPDVVLLMNAINDAGVLADTAGYGVRAPQPDGWRAGARWLLQALSARSSLVGLVRRAATFERQEVRRDADKLGALPTVPDPGPYESRVRAWVRSARAFGSEPVLITEPLSTLRNELTPPWTNAGALARFNDAVREIGREENATVVDLAAALLREPDFATPEKLYYDGMHVNDVGAVLYGKIVAEALARDVLPKLRAVRASHSSP
jgi:lysophospholipase L1-like esterase